MKRILIGSTGILVIVILLVLGSLLVTAHPIKATPTASKTTASHAPSTAPKPVAQEPPQPVSAAPATPAPLPQPNPSIPAVDCAGLNYQQYGLYVNFSHTLENELAAYFNDHNSGNDPNWQAVNDTYASEQNTLLKQFYNGAVEILQSQHCYIGLTYTPLSSYSSAGL